MHKEQHQQRTKLCCLLLRFVVDIRPTEEVTEYTASIAYKVLVEGKDGQQTVDSLKFALRAEGMSILFKKRFLTCALSHVYNQVTHLLTLWVQVLNLLRLQSP